MSGTTDEPGTAAAVPSRCFWGMTGRIIDGRIEFVCSTCSFVTTAASAGEFIVPPACPRALSVAVSQVFGLTSPG